MGTKYATLENFLSLIAKIGPIKDTELKNQVKRFLTHAGTANTRWYQPQTNEAKEKKKQLEETMNVRKNKT